MMVDFTKVIRLLIESELTAGYGSLRDHVLPIYIDCFNDV